MAWDVFLGAAKMAWNVLSRVTKTTWDALAGMANGCGMFCPGCQKMAWDVFADDCILYRQIKSQQDCDILQDDLNKLAAWEKKWGMAFHPDKCSAIKISRSRNPISMDYSLKGHILDKEDYTKYLGVELQSSLSWNRHIDQSRRPTAC